MELDKILEVDLYKWKPWELVEKSVLPSGDGEWYFFGPRDRKYPNGYRTNRATRGGYWKSTGTDRRVMCQSRGICIKKTSVYYLGRAPQGVCTHEYHLDDTFSLQDSHALCRVFKKNGICGEVEEAQCSPRVVNDYETMSPDVVVASSSGCTAEEEEEEKDDSRMQFITDDA